MPETLGNLTNLTGFVANDNAIVSPLPDELTNLQALQLLNLNGNQLNFAGLEAVKQMTINDLRYNPQDSTYLLRDEGEIYINAGGNMSDNTYTWYKDGLLFSTVTGNNRLSLDTSGRYRCEVTNNALTDAANTNTNFTLYSGETYIDVNNISDCRTQDSLALVAIYHATNGTNWTETWNFNEPLDWWAGVSIGSNGCVNIVDLSERNLSGKLPSEIGQLTNLKELNLSYNQLYELGGEIAGATELTHLQLNNNRFYQNIPTEIGKRRSACHIFQSE